MVGPNFFWRNLVFFFWSKKQTLPLYVPHDLLMFRVHNNLCVALYNGGVGGGGGSHNIPKMWGWTPLISSPPRPHIICAHSCYCRQYKSIVCFLPFLKKKMDDAPAHLDPCYACFWACNRLGVHYHQNLVHYNPKLPQEDPNKVWLAAPRCVWPPPPPDISWTSRRQSGKKKESDSTKVLPAITSMCTYNAWLGHSAAPPP